MKTSIVLLLLLAGCSTQTSEPTSAPAAAPPPAAPAAAKPAPKPGPQPPAGALQPGEPLPQPVQSESVPRIAAVPVTTPMPILTAAEQDLWSHFAAALASRNLSLDASSTRLLRERVHRAENLTNIDQAKADLTSLADELQKEGPGVIDETKAGNALRRWCPRAPFC